MERFMPWHLTFGHNESPKKPICLSIRGKNFAECASKYNGAWVECQQVFQGSSTLTLWVTYDTSKKQQQLIH